MDVYQEYYEWEDSLQQPIDDRQASHKLDSLSVHSDGQCCQSFQLLSYTIYSPMNSIYHYFQDYVSPDILLKYEAEIDKNMCIIMNLKILLPVYLVYKQTQFQLHE